MEVMGSTGCLIGFGNYYHTVSAWSREGSLPLHFTLTRYRLSVCADFDHTVIFDYIHVYSIIFEMSTFLRVKDWRWLTGVFQHLPVSIGFSNTKILLMHQPVLFFFLFCFVIDSFTRAFYLYWWQNSPESYLVVQWGIFPQFGFAVEFSLTVWYD